MFYILEDKVPVKVQSSDPRFLELLSSDDGRIVGRDVIGNFLVSTVFLSVAIDATHLFETMVFDESGDESNLHRMQYRYGTWDEAVAGHAATVSLVKATLN